MEPDSQRAFTPQIKSQLFQALGLEERDWQDLGGFESFVFANTQQQRILRLTHTSHRSAGDIESELEFLRGLKAAGAAVCAPMLFDSNRYQRAIGEFNCCQFEMAQGRTITEPDWQPALFRAWGRAIGQFHKFSVSFAPQGPKRFDWRADANLHFRSRVPGSEAALLQISDSYLNQLETLAADSSNYGLIHSDAHAGNFFLQENGDLKFFDFDDCCYQWFAFDVATILFSAILQPWMADDQSEREAIALQFFPEFLQGYDAEFEVSDFLLDVLPLFLKLREFSLYAVIHSHMDVNHLTDWYPIKFMQGRQQRLLDDLPYLNINFQAL